MNGSAESSRLSDAVFVWVVLLVLTACVVAFAFQTRDCFVDDAFTGFQYLGNLTAGNGFVFHVGDPPVEGVTNIGWLLLLAPFCRLGNVTIAAKLAGLALVLFNLVLTACLGCRLAATRASGDCFDFRVRRGNPSVKRDSPIFADTKIGTVPAPVGNDLSLAFVPCLMLATSFEFVYFSLAGMETGLLATLLLLMAVIALDRPRSLLLPVLGAIAFLIHPEAVVVYPLYMVLGWTNRRHERVGATAGLSSSNIRQGNGRRLLDAIVFFALLGVISAVRVAYFGDVVPNTFHAKPSGLGAVAQNFCGLLTGENVNVAFPITGWLAIPVLMIGYLRLRRTAPAQADLIAAICGTGLAFAVYSPADWTALPRYFAPYLPAALILLWAGLCEVADRLLGSDGQARTKHAVVAVVAVVLLLTNVADGRVKMSQMDVFPGYILSGKNLVAPSKWIGAHVPADATIATRRIGALAYFSGRHALDYSYGLTEPVVARLVARRGRRFDTPTDAALARLWQTRRPDYLLEDAAIMDYIIEQAGGTRQRFSIHGIPYSVVKEFPVGSDASWVLARRIDQ